MARKFLALFIIALLAVPTVSFAADYPAQNISGAVQWGADGGTDSLMRPLSALAEQTLGKSIITQTETYKHWKAKRS